MTTKAEHDAQHEREKMQKLADEYDPPRPWRIERRESKDPAWPIVYVLDARDHVIPHFTTVYESTMVRRIIAALALADAIADIKIVEEHDAYGLDPYDKQHYEKAQRVVEAIERWKALK